MTASCETSLSIPLVGQAGDVHQQRVAVFVQLCAPRGHVRVNLELALLQRRTQNHLWSAGTGSAGHISSTPSSRSVISSCAPGSSIPGGGEPRLAAPPPREPARQIHADRKALGSEASSAVTAPSDRTGKPSFLRPGLQLAMRWRTPPEGVPGCDLRASKTR